MKTSAGILLYRTDRGALEVLLGHPGGPFFRNKDDGFWSIPKGGADPEEDLICAARREFLEETNVELPASAAYLPLGVVKQDGRKLVHVWAVEAAPGFVQPPELNSQRFQLEWPPGSGRMQDFPELDRIAFFSLSEARQKLLYAQQPFLDRLERLFDQSAAGESGAANM